MSSNNQHGEFINVRPACLTAFIALIGFAMAAVVFLAFSINKDSWSFRLPECPAPRATPSFLQIQVLGDDNNSTRDVMVDPEKNPWVSEVISALQQIHTKVNDDSPGGNMVIDPAKNLWIDKLINAVRDADKRQSGVPVVGANPTSNVVIDRGKNPWVNELIDALREGGKSKRVALDAGVNSNGDGDDKPNAPTGSATATDRDNQSKHEANVVVDLKKPSWVDDLANTILSAAEFRAMDPAIRAEVKKHLICPDGTRLTISDIIRFPIGKHSLNDAAVDGVENFLCKVGGQATDWRIYGFASGEGGEGVNRELSRQRACAVNKYICENNDRLQCDASCKTYPGNKGKKAEAGPQCVGANGNTKNDFLTCFLGEEHFINSVADSRSVVIAACKTKE